MITKDEYPKRRNILACWFHMDWDETADTYRGVVDVGLSTLDAASASVIANEIAALLASPVTNEELAKWLEPFCYVILEGEGYTPRSFVQMVADRIRARNS